MEQLIQNYTTLEDGEFPIRNGIGLQGYVAQEAKAEAETLSSSIFMWPEARVTANPKLAGQSQNVHFKSTAECLWDSICPGFPVVPLRA